jgi:hypothetical protein
LAVGRGRRRRSRRSATHPVCVRLCDGAFFPVASTSSSIDDSKNEAICGGLCPDARTALYLEPAGSDEIEDAVSTNGVPYTSLPAALRFRTALDATCTCRRKLAQQFSIMLDSTLRKGDYVMTPKGLMVFTGSQRLPHASSDFIAVADARLSQVQRAAVLAMGQVGPSIADGPTDNDPAPRQLIDPRHGCVSPPHQRLTSGLEPTSRLVARRQIRLYLLAMLASSFNDQPRGGDA